MSLSILFFKSSISLTLVLYTFVLTYLHETKSNGVKSEDHGAQEIGPPLPIHLSSNFSFNHARTSFEECGGVQSFEK